MDNYIDYNQVTESSIAKERGLTRVRMRKLREKAKQDIHWYKAPDIGTRKGPVCWTDEGLEWLDGELGTPEGGKGLPGASEEVFGRGVQKPMNQKLLVCEIRGRGEKVLVRNQKNFKIGMLVPVKQVDGNIYIATKHPNHAGKFL
jgi:hypothetical protein